MSYSAEVLTDTPIVYWKLEDPSGTTSPVADSSSGGTRTGTVNGTVTPGFGDTAIFPSLGTALGLSGGGSNYVYRSTDSVWDFGTGDFAVEFVVIDNNSLSNYSELFGIDDVASGVGLDLYVNQTTGTLRLWCGGTAMNGSISIVDGDPHLITITRESGVVKFYVDGVLDASSTMAGSLRTAQALRVGVVSNAYPSLIGEIGHFSLYAHSLSAARVDVHAEELGLVVITENPNQGAFGYIYENVGFDVVSEQEAEAYVYENVGFHVVNTQEAHGFAYENVGYVPVDPDDPKQAEAYIFEEVIGFVGSYWGIRLGTGGTPVAPDSRKIYVISEEFPSALEQLDPDSMTLDTLAGPVATGTGSTGVWSWEMGGAALDGQEVVGTFTPYTPAGGGAFWSDFPDLRIRSLPEDLSSASTAVDTTQPYYRSTLHNGANVIAAANGKIYTLAGTEWVTFTWYTGTVHCLGGLKIIEVDPSDGTVTNSWDVPEPPEWWTTSDPHDNLDSITPFYQYPGEDSGSIPSLCVSPDGSAIYFTAMTPTPVDGRNYWDQTVMKLDISSGDFTTLIPKLYDYHVEGFWLDMQDFMTTNWPEETSPGYWQFYLLGGLACTDDGDLLVADQQETIIARIDSTDGHVKQLIIGQDAPSSPSGSDYASTQAPYGTILGIAAKGDLVFVSYEGEVALDDGTGTDTSNWVDPDTQHWVLGMKIPDPTITKISLLDRDPALFPRRMFNERVYCIWTG
jgi:hypothetical protein